MDSLQSAPLCDQRDEGDGASLVPKESPIVENVRSDVSARDADVGRVSSDQSNGVTRKGSDFPAGLRAGEPSVRVPHPHLGLKNEKLVSDSPSIGKRIFRSLSRFLVAALIGVGATLTWQTYGDEAKEQAKEMVRTWAPSWVWLLPISATRPSPDINKSSVQTASTGHGIAGDAASTQSLSHTQEQIPPATANISDVMQQLESMSREFAALRQSVEQLTIKHEQMAQNIAALQAAEQELRKTMSSLTPIEAVPLPPRKNPPKVVAQPPTPAAQSLSAPRPAPMSRPPFPLR